jgi:hypothetical protein
MANDFEYNWNNFSYILFYRIQGREYLLPVGIVLKVGVTHSFFQISLVFLIFVEPFIFMRKFFQLSSRMIFA